MTLWNLLFTLLFGYPLPPEMVDPRFPLFLQRFGGLLLTLLLTMFSLVIGAGIGIVLALCRRKSPTDAKGHLLTWLLCYAAGALVEGVRGLPIMLLVLLTFYLPYPLVGLRYPPFVLAIAIFSLYAGVYLSETIHSGFRSVDPQLRDAGQILGLTHFQILRRIELPLIYRTMLPDVINVAITVFKDTSTLAIVAVPELMYTGRQMLMSEPLNYGVVLLLILLSYWAPVTIFSMFAFRAEQRRVYLETY